jgi:hypothetical protein
MDTGCRLAERGGGSVDLDQSLSSAADVRGYPRRHPLDQDSAQMSGPPCEILQRMGKAVRLSVAVETDRTHFTINQP